MIYSPIFDLYFRHERKVHDFLVQFMIILVTYLIDSFVLFIIRFNLPFLSLWSFIGGYLLARFIIRKKRKQHLFGGLANYGPLYSTTLGVANWIIYLIVIRLPKLTEFGKNLP